MKGIKFKYINIFIDFNLRSDQEDDGDATDEHSSLLAQTDSGYQ